MNDSPFTELPAELLLRVIKYIPFINQCSLSATNSNFRQFLVPTLFKSLKISSNLKDASANEKGIERIGRHVESLSFECHLIPNELEHESQDDALEDGFYREESEEDDSVSYVSPFLTGLLSGKGLPALRTMRIIFLPRDDFGPDGDWTGTGQSSIYIHERLEEEYEMDDPENTFGWRRMMADTFSAIASNKIIKKLQLRNLIPKPTSTFFTEDWQKFLGRLETFDVALWGSDNGAGWHSNTQPGYLDFISDLGFFLFDHLVSAKIVMVSSDPGNPMGCFGTSRHAPLPLSPLAMPKIEQLELRNCFIDTALVDFLLDISQQLKSLRLDECFSSGGPWGFNSSDDRISWAELFRKIYSSKSKLSSLIVVNSRQPLTFNEEFHQEENGPFIPSHDEPGRVKAARKRLAADDRLRLFPYAYLDDKYGMVFMDEDVILEQFEIGDDQKAFDQLTAWVNSMLQGP